MDTITITITETERKRLILLAEDVIKSGHWGNAVVEIPEESRLFEVFQRSAGTIEMSVSQVALLMNWLMEGTGYGMILLGEDVSILQKIAYKLYRFYNYRKEACIRELENVSELIKKSENLLPGKGFNLPLEHLRELEDVERNEAYRRLRQSIDSYEAREDDVGSVEAENVSDNDASFHNGAVKERYETGINRSRNTGVTLGKVYTEGEDLNPDSDGIETSGKSFFSRIFSTKKKTKKALDTNSIGESINAKELVQKTEKIAKRIGKRGR
ncbi:MAG: hypothetical protein JXA20_08090 [Spirochaetes bacterium]|nr:hypothetical protein [Spirochaetota bacterium]